MPFFAKQNRRFKGRLWEGLAAALLMLKGYRILATNTRFGGVEVDILAQKDDVLCLVEVKYRSGGESRFEGVVHPTQQARLLRAARSAAPRFGGEQSVRIDCVLCTPYPPFLRHVTDVFS